MPGRWIEITTGACSKWRHEGYFACGQQEDQSYQGCEEKADMRRSGCNSLGPFSGICNAVVWVVDKFCKAGVWLGHLGCVSLVWISGISCLSHSPRKGKWKAGTMLLLTDGTVICSEMDSTGNSPTTMWWKLTPDSEGSYVGGSWTRISNSLIARLFFASAVLADGRVLVCGGEYSNATRPVSRIPDRTNASEIYNPLTDVWTAVPPPFAAGATTPGPW